MYLSLTIYMLYNVHLSQDLQNILNKLPFTYKSSILMLMEIKNLDKLKESNFQYTFLNIETWSVKMVKVEAQ